MVSNVLNFKRISSFVAAGLFAIFAIPAIANAATGTTEVVTEDEVVRQAEGTTPTNHWVIYTRNATPGTATFQSGPATPPLGSGSLELSTISGSDKVWAFNYDHVGTKLSDINKLEYNTYRTEGTEQQVASINLEIDFNGPDASGGYSVLVFEPVYNKDQGDVTNDTWQNWDAYNGGEGVWWSSRAIPGAPNQDTFVSWSTIVAANPDATILGGYGVNQGSGNPILTSAVDALAIGYADKAVTYDFELEAPATKPVKATDKEQCKNGNYKNFQTKYKNQGHCVSSVASNGKARNNDR